MTSEANLPPMTHSSAYHERRNSPLSPHLYQQHQQQQLQQHHYHHYPQTQTLPPTRPQPAHYPKSPALSHRTDPNRAHSSVSSGESGSTVASDFKPYVQKQPYQHGSQLESGLGDDRNGRQSYFGSSSHAEAHVNNQGPSEMTEDQSAVFRYIQRQQAEDEAEKEDDHALSILAWMSFVDPFYCFFGAIFTIFAVLIVIVLLPLRICRRESSSSTTLIRMIGPIYRNHLQMIHAKSLGIAHTFEFSPSCLVLTQLIAPIISVGNAVAAWVVAVFWVFAIIMGNPDGTEKRDDGRATVLMLRDWWEKCLLYAIRK